MSFVEIKLEGLLSHSVIDSQHVNLISLLDNLVLVAKNSAGNEDILQLYERVYSYARHHFQTEEKMMRESNYFMAKDHIEQHNNILWIISRSSQEIGNGKGDTAIEQLSYCYEYLLRHIHSEDVEFFRYHSIASLDA
ncbi:hemerythrin family protein [Solidesulfovibrio magneticus]|uniref:Hemerythrin family protein n=1 Tax=Solidesulfovibrio magneticus (strain ATCC 700980 / DSM 13731 / RS-1) TaxID=573370 RepID=C4XM33_SOLM1|nr:hemerythrin family protein [Solidesulfovibrio magneticus]BAH77161.1 hemerythrin family protein [Solidesulfovibrio magneticus RS-1]